MAFEGALSYPASSLLLCTTADFSAQPVHFFRYEAASLPVDALKPEKTANSFARRRS